MESGGGAAASATTDDGGGTTAGGGENVPAVIRWPPVVDEIGDDVEEIMAESRHTTEAEMWWGCGPATSAILRW